MRAHAPSVMTLCPPPDFSLQFYRGLKIPKVQQWHKNLQLFMGTTLWLWMFWRIKNDGAAFIVRARPRRPLSPGPAADDRASTCAQGLCHPWDHGDHGHGDDHGDGHGEGHGH